MNKTYIVVNSDGTLHSISSVDDSILDEGQSLLIADIPIATFVDALPSEPHKCKVVNGEYVVNESYVEKKIYNAKRFLASCAVDENMLLITAKMDTRQYFDFAMCLQNANFDMVQVLVATYLTQGVISTNDVAYFSNKLYNEEGVAV